MQTSILWLEIPQSQIPGLEKVRKTVPELESLSVWLSIRCRSAMYP